jgi:hypothetical protein
MESDQASSALAGGIQRNACKENTYPCADRTPTGMSFKGTSPDPEASLHFLTNAHPRPSQVFPMGKGFGEGLPPGATGNAHPGLGGSKMS